jgi:hypothetical protein
MQHASIQTSYYFAENPMGVFHRDLSIKAADIIHCIGYINGFAPKFTLLISMPPD